ncbi:MAG: HesA/MoeB/ThiF family protein, partial [Polyangiales bacterium]
IVTINQEIEAKRRSARVLVLGLGGLGAPASIALANAGIGTLILVDDDEVDLSNLHRQVLYRNADVGRPKVEAARDALLALAPAVAIELRPGRLRPGTESLLDGVDVIVECTDRYAVKFLASSAAIARRTPIVHGAAIRWIGTAMSVGGKGGPCYACVFEAPPDDGQATCDVSGVVGPVCGVVGAVQAAMALEIVDDVATARFGTLASYDGRVGDGDGDGDGKAALRFRTISRRATCPVCGASA